ncbi:GIY-YIG nuclease family protein [Thomasclavelia sp.]
MKINYVYIVECSDHTYYTGWTTNLERRIETHNKGNGAKYTKARCPVKLIYFEEFVNKNQALKREHAIKQLTRKQKELLIKDFSLIKR